MEERRWAQGFGGRAQVPALAAVEAEPAAKRAKVDGEGLSPRSGGGGNPSLADFAPTLGDRGPNSAELDLVFVDILRKLLEPSPNSAASSPNLGELTWSIFGRNQSQFARTLRAPVVAHHCMPQASHPPYVSMFCLRGRDGEVLDFCMPTSALAEEGLVR